MSKVISYYAIVASDNGKGIDVVKVERGARHGQKVVATFPTQPEALADMERRNAPIFAAHARQRPAFA